MSLFEETKRKVSLGAGLRDAAAARANCPVLESCDPERRVMVPFGLGITTYLLLRDVSLNSFCEPQASCGMSAKYYSIYFYELSVLLQ